VTQDPESAEAPTDRRGPHDPPGPEWLYRWRQRVAGDSRYRQLVWRSVATALGVGIVIAGIVLLPLPGPGWAIIFLGLAVLATEYAWAHRLLTVTRDKAQSASATAFSPQNRRRTVALLVIGALVVAGLVAWYVETYGWALGGVTGWLGFG
jgi:uncharacterized protein (TIGR02611 family)